MEAEEILKIFEELNKKSWKAFRHALDMVRHQLAFGVMMDLVEWGRLLSEKKYYPELWLAFDELGLAVESSEHYRKHALEVASKYLKNVPEELVKEFLKVLEKRYNEYISTVGL